MSAELAIKARHVFEDRLQRYLELLSILNDRELQLLFGRLSDMQVHSPLPAVAVRLEVVEVYMQLRSDGRRKHRQVKRLFYSPHSDLSPLRDPTLDRSDSDYLVRAAANFELFWSGLKRVPPAQVECSLPDSVLAFSR